MANNSNENSQIFQNALQNNRGSASRRLQQQHMQQRVIEREREQRLREAEDTRIEVLHEKIAMVVADQDISEDQRRLRVTNLTSQITQIHTGRAEREVSAAEREVLRQQQLIAERQREQEESAEEQRTNNIENANSEEELQQQLANENIRSLTMMSARMDHITALNITRTRLESEATHLEQAAGDTEGWIVTRLSNGALIPSLTTFTSEQNSDDFREAHLRRLNQGISRLEVAVAKQVGSLYRDGQVMQEAQLRYMREGAQAVTDEEERAKEHEYSYQPVVDARL
jgi:hypothetical protein